MIIIMKIIDNFPWLETHTHARTHTHTHTHIQEPEFRTQEPAFSETLCLDQKISFYSFFPVFLMR